jgi:hypothetical protein
MSASRRRTTCVGSYARSPTGRRPRQDRGSTGPARGRRGTRAGRRSPWARPCWSWPPLRGGSGPEPPRRRRSAPWPFCRSRTCRRLRGSTSRRGSRTACSESCPRWPSFGSSPGPRPCTTRTRERRSPRSLGSFRSTPSSRARCGGRGRASACRWPSFVPARRSGRCGPSRTSARWPGRRISRPTSRPRSPWRRAWR